MKTIKYFFCILLLIFTSNIYPQDQSILIFDPADVSTSFQYTLSELTEDSVLVADTLDDSIFNYDAAFLFLDYSNSISETFATLLIDYTSSGKPTYLFSQPAMDSAATPFWNHIGLSDFVWLLISTLVDSVEGIDSTFTKGIDIDTSFMSGGIPELTGTLSPILIGRSTGLEIFPTYLSNVDTLQVILDLYNLIDDEGFLRRVLEFFKLIPPLSISDEIVYTTNFNLSQNYPNPFNPSTKIKFEIPDQVWNDNRFVTLKVYDVLGNEIATLVNEEKQPGTYEVEFNTSSIKHLPSTGIYFYQIKAGNYTETKKMILLK